MTDKELMQQALEALESLADTSWTAAFKQRKYDSDEPNENVERERVLGVITALRERLAQHEALDQLIADSQSMGAYSLDQVKAVLRQDDPQFDERMQRARERLAQPEPEPVAWVTGWHDGHCVIRAANPAAILPIGIALYTTPPRREWVGMTEEEVDECYYWKGRQWTTDELVRHVEAKLKEKNA